MHVNHCQVLTCPAGQDIPSQFDGIPDEDLAILEDVKSSSTDIGCDNSGIRRG